MTDSKAFVLPRLGDRLMRKMTSINFGTIDTKPEPCVVTYVNKPKRWYQVTFVKSGIKECYKVPETDNLAVFKEYYERAFNKKAKGVYVYESGQLYPSVTECAKALGVLPCTISKHLHGGSRHVKGYHIYIL
jgi:hypothetical protein